MASYCTFICNLFFYSTSSLWDSSRDVCSSLCFHSFIHCMNISQFIHEFFGWCNAGCFQLLTIAINAAVNILVHISMGTCKRIALRIYLGEQFLSQRVCISLIFLNIAKLLSKVIVPIYTLTRTTWVPMFLILANTLCCQTLKFLLILWMERNNCGS